MAGSKRFSAEKNLLILNGLALGVYFSYKDDAAEHRNFEPKIKILKTTLNICMSIDV